MAVLAIILAAILLLISGLHIIWGFRIWWPSRSEAELAYSVTGFRKTKTMPGSVPCFLVATVLMLAAVTAISLVELLLRYDREMTVIAGILFSLVFLGRGAIAYTGYWRRLTPEEPFRTLDQRYFSPLCILLGLSFIILIYRFIL